MQGSPGTDHGPGPFRNVLGFVPPGYPGYPQVTLRFSVSRLDIVLRPGATTLGAHLDATARRLKRNGWSPAAPFPSPVLGYDGMARMVTRKKKRFRQPAAAPEVQSYAVVGPCALTVSAAQADAGLAQNFGPVRLDPAPPPILTPVVRMPVDPAAVAEKVRATQGSVSLTGTVTPGPVTVPADQFAMQSMTAMQQRVRNVTVGDYQSDVFLGGWPCVRYTFLIGGNQRAVTSEFWWYGVVADRGITISVGGTTSIIDQHEARRLKDLVALIPPG